MRVCVCVAMPTCIILFLRGASRQGSTKLFPRALLLDEATGLAGINGGGGLQIGCCCLVPSVMAYDPDGEKAGASVQSMFLSSSSDWEYGGVEGVEQLLCCVCADGTKR